MNLKSFTVVFLLMNLGMWAQTSNHHGGIFGFSENLVYVMADGGEFFKSEDAGLNWEKTDTGIAVEFYGLNFYDQNLGFAIGQTGKILKTTNSGQSWVEISSGTINDLYSIGFGALDNFYIVGDAGTVLHSIDQGESWNTITGISSERLNHINFKDDNIAYIAGDNGTLLYTENTGSSWEILDVGNTDDLYIASITENAVQLLSGPARTYFFREGKNTLVSSDNLDWNNFIIYTDMFEPYSGFHFQNDNEGYVVTSADALCECCYIEIAKTTDGGQTWETIFWEKYDEDECNTQVSFSDISFVNNEYGYVLIGNHVITITPHGIFTNSITLKTEKFNQNVNFALYPNPTNKKINLLVQNHTIDKMHVDITDLTGKTVFSKNLTSYHEQIDIEKFSSGLYLVSLKQNGKILGHQKLIKL